MSSNLMISGGTSGPASVSTINGSTTAVRNLTLSASANGQAGDLLLEFCGAKHTAGLTVNPNWDGINIGWTEVIDQNAKPNIEVAWKLDGSGSDVSSVQTSVQAAVFGVLSTRWRFAAYDTIGAIATIVADGNLVMPSITAVGGVLLAFMFADNAATLGTPTGFNDVVSGTWGSGVSGWKLCQKPIGGGATGTATSAVSGLSGTAGGVLVALK